MKFSFASNKLRDLYEEEKGARRYPPQVVGGFFEVMDFIDNASNESDLYALASLHYHKLKGDRKHQRALNLTGKYRLIVERVSVESEIELEIVDIEDYH